MQLLLRQRLPAVLVLQGEQVEVAKMEEKQVEVEQVEEMQEEVEEEQVEVEVE